MAPLRNTVGRQMNFTECLQPALVNPQTWPQGCWFVF